MKKLILMLLAMPFLLASCSNEEPIGEEAVEVTFKADLGSVVATRAVGDLTIDKVVYAIFENGNEIKGLRTTIDVTDANKNSLSISSRLVKGHTYQAVFWAMKGDSYNVVDMKSITRNGTPAEADCDAFTASVQVEATNSQTVTVSLVRPLAQINIGVTAEDWTAAKDVFGMTPTKCNISFTGHDAFNAFAGTVAGTEATVSRSVASTGDDMTVNSVVYKHVGTCYVFSDSNKDITVSVEDQNQTSISGDVAIPGVPVQSNYKTNIVGGILTGSVTYSISIQEGFSTTEHNKEF